MQLLRLRELISTSTNLDEGALSSGEGQHLYLVYV